MVKQRKYLVVLAIFCLGMLLATPARSLAQEESRFFNVDFNYDFSSRKTVESFLKISSQKALFYLERSWYNNLTDGERLQVDSMIGELSSDFDNLIYPKLTAVFGNEWKPGIDNNEKITILFHKLKENGAGYMRTQDEFSSIQAVGSNEREMIYINSQFLFQPIVKSLVAHEFVHLIEYNQKERLKNIEEETWLSELRAEVAPTIIGYDNDYQNSNLARRVKAFLDNSHDSLILWNNDSIDYGVVNLFGQYLLDHYGVKVLGDSLKNNSKGVASLEQALIQNGINQSFGEIFSNFNLALFFNDCNLGEAYCFKNANLKNIKVAPALIILPNTQQTELSLRYQITDWSGNWYRLSMAGVADLGLNFEGDLAGQFKIPYAVCQANGTCSIANLELDEAKKGVINLSRFGEQGRYLVLAPTIQDLTVNSQTQAKSYNFNLVLKAGLSVATTTSSIQDSSTIILRAKILELEQQIILLKQKLAGNLDAQSGSCGAFLVNLKFGQVSSSVRCLQMFLQKQGLGIYPEGWVTGYFGLATQKAVIRFQEKYLAEILTPFGLTKGTGLVGTKTREKINAMR